MIECNISGLAKILLIIQLLLVMTEAQKNVTKNGTTKLTYAFDKQKVTETAVSYHFNVIIMGGIFNMTLSLINLVFGLVNFYLIFGRYEPRLRQIAAKLKIAVDEMSSRDLHPKIKMSLSRRIPPKDIPALRDITKLFNEPSKMFDNSNELLAGQKETRLRKLTEKKDKEENTSMVKSVVGQKSQASEAKSTPTEAKKTK